VGVSQPGADRLLAAGKPTDNVHVESFNGTLRAECLDVHWFATLIEAKQVTDLWENERRVSSLVRSL
jgi:putative transposase